MANSDKISEGYYVSTLPDTEINRDIDISGSTISGLASANDVTGVSISNASMEDYWITSSSIDWSISATPFVDCMPDLDRVNEMCEEYPALAKALENFKTVYAMVEQDWKGKNK